MESLTHGKFSFVLITAYAVIFTGLTTVAIWDVRNIIRDFVYDNRATSVKVKETADRLPFLSNRTQVCLAYDQPLFDGWPKIPFPSRITPDLSNIVRKMLYRKNFPWTRTDQNVTISSLEDAFAVGAAYYVVRRLETDASRNFLDTVYNFTSDYNITDIDVVDVLDKFISHPSRSSVVQQAWNYFMPYFTDPDVGKKAPVFDRVEALNGICFKISLFDDLYFRLAGAAEASAIYRFDIQQPAVRNSTKIAAASKLTITVLGEVLETPPQLFPNASASYQLTIQISNDGIFDSTSFPPCTTAFESELECKIDTVRRTLKELCQCTPSTLENLESDQKPCTIEKYKRCWETSAAEIDRRIEDLRFTKDCKSCVLYKNTYRIGSPTVIKATPTGPRFVLQVSCSKRKYLYFEDREQYGISQMVSQIGGDLGLYIGFSMISILELSLFVYHTYHKRKEFQRHVASGANEKSMFKTFWTYIGRHFQFVLHGYDQKQMARDVAALDSKVRISEEHRLITSDRLDNMDLKINAMMEVLYEIRKNTNRF